MLERILEWFGTLEKFERFVREDLHRQVEGLLLRQGPMPYKIVLVGSISHVLITSTQLFICWKDDAPELFWRFVFVGSMISFCTDAIAVTLVLKLADTSFGDDVEGRPWFRRKLAGPLVTAGIFSILTAIAITPLSPAVPLWIGVMLLLLACCVLCCFGLARHAPMPASTELKGPEDLSCSVETGDHGDSQPATPSSFAVGHAGIPEAQTAP